MSDIRKLTSRDGVLAVSIIVGILLLYFYNQQIRVSGSIPDSINSEYDITTHQPLPSSDQSLDISRPYPITKETKTFTSYEGKFAIDIPIDWTVELRSPRPTNGLLDLSLEEIRGEDSQSASTYLQYVFRSPEDQFIGSRCDRDGMEKSNECYAPHTLSLSINNLLSPVLIDEETVPGPNTGQLSWTERENPYWAYAGPGRILYGNSSTHRYSFSVRDVDVENTEAIIDSFRVVDFRGDLLLGGNYSF